MRHPYRHSVVSLQEVDVCRIPAAALGQLQAEHPWLADRLMEHWENHLRLADRWIGDLSSGSVRSRTARLLILMLELTGDSEDRLALLSYEDMAAVIGTSREMFTRVIGQLRRAGALAQAGANPVYQCDVGALREIA